MHTRLNSKDKLPVRGISSTSKEGGTDSTHNNRKRSRFLPNFHFSVTLINVAREVRV